MKRLIGVSMLLGSLAWGQGKVCTPNPNLTSLPAEIGNSTIQVLAAYIDAEGKRSSVLPTSDEQIQADQSLPALTSWAKGKNCQYLNLMSLIRLGETVQVSVKVVDLNSNAEVHKKLYTARDPEDLNPIMAQVGATLNDDSFESQESIYDVSAASSKSLRKKRSYSHYSANIGYIGFLAPEASGAFGYGAAATWDNRTFIGELDFSLYTLSEIRSVGLIDLGINIYIPHTDQDATFYYGGGLGIGSFLTQEYDPGGNWNCSNSVDDDNCYSTTGKTSLLLHGAVGYMIGRTSDFNVRFQADTKVGTVQVDQSYPVGVGARLIIGFEG